jgi:hypothetical protein
MNRTVVAAAILAAVCAGAAPSRAAPISQTLSTANWTNGATNIGTGNFAGGGGPAPFDTIIGDKSLGPDPSTSFTFSGYGGPIASPISSASIEIGLYDGSSPNPAAEVSFFTLNGSSVAAELTAALEAANPVRNGEIYYTVTLPSTVYADLATGTSTFALGLTGPGLGLLGNSNFTLFGLDFATLTINTGTTPPPTVPEPPAAALLLTGLVGLVAFRRRGVG